MIGTISVWHLARLAAVVLVSTLSAILYLQLKSTSAVSIVLLLMIARLYTLAPAGKGFRGRVIPCVLALVFGSWAVAGKLSEDGNWVTYLVHRTILPVWLNVAIYVVMAAGLAGILHRAILWADDWLDRARVVDSEAEPVSGVRVWWVAFAAIVTSWLPFLLCYWPGILTPDSQDQLMQAQGAAAYLDVHPIFHTLLIQACYRLGQGLFGSVEAGIATYTVAQMLLLGATFAWVIARLHGERVRREVLLVVWAIYALLPLHGMYAITMWKNIPFACATVGLTVALWDLGRSRSSSEYSRALLQIAICGCLVVLLQKNGAAAWLLVACCALAGALRRSRMTFVALALPLLAVVIEHEGSRRAGVVPSSDLVFRGLSIPVQQVARTLVDGGQLSVEEIGDVESIAPVAEIIRLYDRHMVDPMKKAVSEKRADAIVAGGSRYLRLWLALGLRYPGAYIAAYRDQTCGYWYPNVSYSNIWQTFEGARIGATRRPLLGGALCALVSKVTAYSEFLPLFAVLRSIGLYVWVAILMAGYAFSRHERAALLCYVPVFAVWVSLLLSTPIFAELRYIYSLFAVMPILVLAPLIDRSYAVAGSDQSSDRSQAHAGG